MQAAPGASDVASTLAPDPSSGSATGTGSSAAPADATGGVNDNNYQAALSNLTNFQAQAPTTPTTDPTASAVDPSSGSSGTSPGWNAISAAIPGWDGTNYVYGGTTKAGVDCSGLTSALYSAAGLNIGRTTGQQMASPLGKAVGQDGNFASVQGQLQPGDLIFYGQKGASGPNAHVVMYVGNGQVVQAAHTGTKVGTTALFSQASSDEPFAGVRRYLSPSVATAANGTNPTINNTTDFARALLTGLGDATTAANMSSIVNWENREGGNFHNSAKFNPLNTTQSEPGYTKTGSQGDIGAYVNWLQGLQATQTTLNNGRYADILAALKGGGGLNNGNYAGLSTWSGGGYNHL